MAQMAVFGLVKNLASQESVINRCIWTHTIGQMYFVWFLLYITNKEPVQSYNFVSVLHLPFWSALGLAHLPLWALMMLLYLRLYNSSDFQSYLLGN